MISRVTQKKSGVGAAFVFEAEGKRIGTAELKNNITFGGMYTILSHGREYMLSYDTGERLAGAVKSAVDKKRVPYKITNVHGNACGAIYEKRSDGFFLTRYSYYEMELDGRNYTMYAVGLGNEGMKYPVYLGNVQVALIEKESVVRDNLDCYMIYTIDGSYNFPVYLLCLYIDARFYGNRGEITADKVEKSVTITLNKEVKSKYDASFKMRCNTD